MHSRYARNLYDPKIKIIFEIAREEPEQKLQIKQNKCFMASHCNHHELISNLNATKITRKITQFRKWVIWSTKNLDMFQDFFSIISKIINNSYDCIWAQSFDLKCNGVKSFLKTSFGFCNCDFTRFFINHSYNIVLYKLVWI